MTDVPPASSVIIILQHKNSAAVMAAIMLNNKDCRGFLFTNIQENKSAGLANQVAVVTDKKKPKHPDSNSAAPSQLCPISLFVSKQGDANAIRNKPALMNLAYFAIVI
jgi:hypothetical protein